MRHAKEFIKKIFTSLSNLFKTGHYSIIHAKERQLHKFHRKCEFYSLQNTKKNHLPINYFIPRLLLS